MLQRGDRSTNPRQILLSTFGNQNAGLVAGLRQDQPPWIDDHRTPIAGSVRTVPAALSRGNDEALTFDRASA